MSEHREFQCFACGLKWFSSFSPACEADGTNGLFVPLGVMKCPVCGDDTMVGAKKQEAEDE